MNILHHFSKPLFLYFLILSLSALYYHTVVKGGDPNPNTEQQDDSKQSPSLDWEYLLRQSATPSTPIIANGNVFPPPPSDHSSNCLLLLTNSRIIRHCPDVPHDSNQTEGSTRVIYSRSSTHIRGMFVLPGNEGEDKRDKVWFLSTPGRKGFDYLEELDLRDGKVKKVLSIPGTMDGHDLVRSGDSLFMCDTRSGVILELALPNSFTKDYEEEDYYEDYYDDYYSKKYLNMSMANPHKYHYDPATVIKRHMGFTRMDHINNIAVHKDVLLLSLHGDDGLKPKIKDGSNSPTRLSALWRHASEDEGKELTKEKDGFEPVDNVGTWCHGIAFWKNEETDQIKLIMLDSKAGSLVSVVLSGPGAETRERQVLWLPDQNHPVLKLPEDLMKQGRVKRYKGMTAFSKGLAVQGHVAYFGVSAARKFREHINPTLLVAVNLKTGEEIFVRNIESVGVINQVVTESYLGYRLRVGDYVDVEMGKEESSGDEEEDDDEEEEKEKEDVAGSFGSEEL